MQLQNSTLENMSGQHIPSLQASVNALLKLANKHCGSSEVAAAVLLSTYNFYDHKLDLGGLCLLDDDNYKHAIRVIGLRCRLGIEPHTIIENGDQQFKQLARTWAHLRTTTIH